MEEQKKGTAVIDVLSFQDIRKYRRLSGFSSQYLTGDIISYEYSPDSPQATAVPVAAPLPTPALDTVALIAATKSDISESLKEGFSEQINEKIFDLSEYFEEKIEVQKRTTESELHSLQTQFNNQYVETFKYFKKLRLRLNEEIEDLRSQLNQSVVLVDELKKTVLVQNQTIMNFQKQYQPKHPSIVNSPSKTPTRSTLKQSTLDTYFTPGPAESPQSTPGRCSTPCSEFAFSDAEPSSFIPLDLKLGEDDIDFEGVSTPTEDFNLTREFESIQNRSPTTGLFEKVKGEITQIGAKKEIFEKVKGEITQIGAKKEIFEKVKGEITQIGAKKETFEKVKEEITQIGAKKEIFEKVKEEIKEEHKKKKKKKSARKRRKTYSTLEAKLSRNNDESIDELSESDEESKEKKMSIFSQFLSNNNKKKRSSQKNKLQRGSKDLSPEERKLFLNMSGSDENMLERLGKRQKNIRFRSSSSILPTKNQRREAKTLGRSFAKEEIQPDTSPLLEIQKEMVREKEIKDRMLDSYRPYEEKIVFCQSVIRRAIAQVNLKAFRRRTNICREFFDTEESYVKDLGLLDEIFTLPLIQKAQTIEEMIIPQEMVVRMFGNAPQIYRNNLIYKQKLENIIMGIKPRWNYYSCLGKLLLQMIPALEPHIEFILNYHTQHQTLKQCRKIPGFHKFLKQCESNPALNFREAEDFLIMPIQRVPRYVMLIKDLLKHTPLSHPDYKDVFLASERIQIFADYINERQRTKDYLFSVCEKIVGVEYFVADSRKCISEGPIIINKKKEYYFLFNDMIVWAHKISPKNNKPQYRHLGKLTFDETTILEEIPCLNSKKGPFGFKIMNPGGDSFVFFAESLKQKGDLMTNINNVIVNSDYNKDPVPYPSFLRPK